MGKSDFKLPKKIAGVKIPKALRTGEIARLLDTPENRRLIADVIVAAATAAAAALVKERAGAEEESQAEGARDAAPTGVDDLPQPASDVAGDDDATSGRAPKRARGKAAVSISPTTDGDGKQFAHDG